MQKQASSTTVTLLAFLAAVVTLPLFAFVSLFGQDHVGSDPLSDEQVRALVQRVLDNQHKDDVWEHEFDRTERSFTRGNGRDIPDRDVINRIIPTRTGQARVELERDGKPTDPTELAKEWANAEQAMVSAVGPRSEEDEEKYKRREQEYENVVASIGKAFVFHFVSRESHGGRSLVRLSFEPDPSFRSSWRYAFVFAHTHGYVWVDEQDAQLVRLEAELREDVTYAAGLVAKLNRGSRVTFEQSQIAPGVWLPARTTYDIDGKKFVFGSLSLHQQIDVSDYRDMGPPEQALALVRREHPEVLADP